MVQPEGHMGSLEDLNDSQTGMQFINHTVRTLHNLFLLNKLKLVPQQPWLGADASDKHRSLHSVE